MAEQQHPNLSTDAVRTANVGEFHQGTEDEISLKEILLKVIGAWNYLLKKWIIILISVIVGGALGFAYAFVKKPAYIARTTFVLEEGESGASLGQYAGLASMMGIDLGSGGGGIFKGENILELYKSRKMIQETLLSQDTFEGRKQLLINRYIEFNKIHENWDKQTVLGKLKFDVNEVGHNRLRDSVMGKIIEDINNGILNVSKPDKKLSIIQVDVKSQDELFSKSFANNIVATVNNFYVATKTKKSTENIKILQHQADSIRQSLNANIGGVAAAVDANPNINPAMQRLRVNSQKKQIDVQANSAIYQEIVKNLELSKVALRKERPLIQVIDEPVFPLAIDRPNKIKSVIILSLISIILTSLFLLMRRIIIGESK